MNREKIAELYKEYGLEKDDVFKHQHYLLLPDSRNSRRFMQKQKLQLTMK